MHTHIPSHASLSTPSPWFKLISAVELPPPSRPSNTSHPHVTDMLPWLSMQSSSCCTAALWNLPLPPVACVRHHHRSRHVTVYRCRHRSSSLQPLASLETSPFVLLLIATVSQSRCRRISVAIHAVLSPSTPSNPHHICVPSKNHRCWTTLTKRPSHIKISEPQ